MRVSLFRVTLVVLYSASLLVTGVAVYFGLDYYQLPVDQRPDSSAHSILKPGGLLGHGFGVVGSAFLILLFLYSLRKRSFLGLRKGSLSRWLDIHIWMGIAGPLFITVHTAGKFGGLVSISYFSMLIVALSGFFGRYVYMQIPRDAQGLALPVEEIDTKIEALGTLLHDDYSVPAKVNSLIQAHAGAISGARLKGWRAFLSLCLLDLLKPIRSYRLARHIRKAFPDCPKDAAAVIVELAKEKAALVRRRATLGTLHSVFHHWHVLHKPLAVVMIVIMLLHVAIVVLMGYKWVF